jgi:hypothetical protein
MAVDAVIYHASEGYYTLCYMLVPERLIFPTDK